MIRPHHLLLVAPMAAAVLTAGAAPAAASSSLPFSVTVSGSAAFTSPYTVAFDGSGYGVLMGTVTNAGTVQITGQDSSCPSGIANVNTEIFSAANGATLTIVSQDVSCPTGPGTFEGSGVWRVSGGTGRFHGATGSGSGFGGGDFNTGTFTNTFTGTVTLAAG